MLAKSILTLNYCRRSGKEEIDVTHIYYTYGWWVILKQENQSSIFFYGLTKTF